MTPDHERESASISCHSHCRNYTGAIVTISMLIALLFAANLYTLDRLNAAREEDRELRSGLGREIGEIKGQNQELSLKYAILKESHARQITQLRRELDYAARQLGASTGQVLDRARVMVGALQRQQSRRAAALEEQIAQKADAQDMAGLTESVSSTQSQLGTEQRTLGVLAQDLGTARSELGELAASTEGQSEALQGFTDGSYQGFTLEKNSTTHIGKIGLRLRKTNVRDQIFSLDLIANDQEIRNRSRSVFEPISFYLVGTRVPYEVVITTVGSRYVAGYIRIPNPGGRREKLAPRT